MAITDEIITGNKETLCMLIEGITREGFNSQVLIDMLNRTDFFIAPASTRYHCSYRGGLCEHTLNVYNSLHDMVHMMHLQELISEDSIRIVAIAHDFAKINLYKETFVNKKVYCSSGSKKDEGGRFDWVCVPGYSHVDESEQFMYGNHEQTSEYIARCYIPLLLEESIAILHHHGGMGFDSSKMPVSGIYEKYKLACLLHLADMASCYIKE